MSFLNNLLSKFSGTQSAPAPVAVSTIVPSINSAEVKFGFASVGQAGYNPEQTYADFVAAQAANAGITLQSNYTAQYLVGTQTYVIDPNLTFAELNAKYNVTPETPVTVSVPDPERPAGRLG